MATGAAIVLARHYDDENCLITVYTRIRARNYARLAAVSLTHSVAMFADLAIDRTSSNDYEYS